MPELRPVFTLADARGTIVEAALIAFAESGFHGATMRDIAQRAGVSQGLVHHHFRGKEALWNFVGERISADFLAYVGEALAPGEPGPDTVPQALRRYMQYWKEHPTAFRFNLWRLLEGATTERRSRSVSITGRGVPLFKQAQDAGFIRNDMPAGLAMIIAGSLVQFWLHSQTEIRDALAVTADDALDDSDFLEHVLDLIRPAAGVARRNPSKGRKRP